MIDQRKPAPSVEWIDNQGQKVEEGRKFKVENTGMNTVFTINKVDASDVGDFTLKIQNRCGQDSYAIGIQVTDRPAAPGKPSVQDQNVDSVKLMWSAPTNDGGSPVRSYIVEMQSSSNKNWIRAEVAKQPMISLFNLVPGETYRFRVKAENAFGQSDPSDESDPVFVKDLSRTVEEPSKKTRQVAEKDTVNYDKLDTKVDATEYKTVDIHRLPNDLQAKYIICEELGRGAYGTVYRAIEKATGKTWAAKMVQVRPGVKKENVLHEISIMNQLHHDKLLNLHEAFDLGNEMCLIEEFVSGGELFEKIMEDESLMSEEEVRDYMHQILLGVQHMHKNSIVHLDLKPENILLKSKNSTDLKIIDFGLARKLDPKKSVKLLFGTPEFCAPEVVNYQPVGLSTDMWTVGVISYVLLSGLSPFLGDNDEDTLANVSAADWDFDDPSWDDVSDLAKDFICRLMVKDKKRRMTVQEALRHPWIAGPLLSAFNDLSEYVKKTQPGPDRSAVPSRQKRNFLSLKRWSDDLLPIGRLAKRGAIFRRLTMDGVFERKIEFETDAGPTIRKKLEDLVANVGDLIATLSCDLAGSPEPKMTWFKDQKEISLPSPKYEARSSDGLTELFIKNIEPSDAGNYTCRATNELGSITTQATLKVDGEDTRKKKKPVEEKAASAPAKKKPTTKAVSEEQPVENSPPNFHHVLADCTAKFAETKILVVTNTTLPEPTVEWYHDGIIVSNTDTKYLKKHDKGRYELEILSCDMDDQGEWKAVGKNAFGVCESKCQLKIEVPSDMHAPSFDIPLSDIRSEEKDMLKMEVKISAVPKPEITWFRGDVEIHHGDRHRLIFDDDTRHYSLTIMNAYKEDSGEYKCVAKNKVGKAQSICSVKIEEHEQKKSKKLDASKAPRFLMHLPNPREIPEGSELVLVCAVTGAPTPNVAWLKNEKPIDMTDKDVRFENGVCTLTVFTTSQEDAGTYVCEASNIHGSNRSTSLVEVKPPVDNLVKPKFVESLLNSSTMEGDEIVLQCAVTAKPNPTITWYKDGLKLIIENRMLQYTDRKGISRLNIMNAMVDDAGEYTCEAVNAAGKDFTHCTVKVVDMGLAKSRLTPSNRRGSRSRSSSPMKSLGEERAPVITRPLSDTTVVEGNRELLEVEVNGCPEPMIEWYHDGKLVAESRTLRTYFDGRVAFLKIYQAQPDQQGVYVCKVSNKMGQVECRATLVVEARRESEHVTNMPTFVRKLQDVVVQNVGESVTLTCQVHGEPTPSVCWLHNGRAIHEQDTRIRMFDDKTAVLEIPRVTEDLCGTYTVVATNEYGDAHSSAEVSIANQVAQKAAACLPYFIVEPKPKIVVEQGSTLGISTDIKGVPEPEIAWLKDNRPLNETDRISFKQDGITYQLVIKNVTLEDEGTYTVTAENQRGKVRENTEVVVSAKREADGKTSVKIVKKDETPGDVGDFELADASSKTVTVTWSPPSEHGSDVEAYEVEMKAPDALNWNTLGKTVKPEYTFKDLKPNTEYVIRVKATKKKLSSPGATYTIKTLPLGEKPAFASSTPSTVSVSKEEGTSITHTFTGLPQPTVKWYKNGKELVESDCVTVAIGDLSTSVVITEPMAGRDDGLYACHLENSEGHAYCETTVIVKEHGRGSSPGSDIAEKVPRGTPVVQKQLNNEAATAGQQFILVCKITSNPKGTTCWYFNDERIEPVGRYEISDASNGVQKLICHSSMEQDTGVYRCVVTNPNGVAQSEASVTVTDIKAQIMPQVIPDNENLTGVMGNQVVLKCNVLGNPEPEVTWTKDGVPVSTSRKAKLTFSNGSSQLIITKCNGEDSGTYLCSAANVVGVHSANIQLTVGETTGTDRHLVVVEPDDRKQQKPRFIRAPASTMEVVEGSQFKLIAKAVGNPKPVVTWKKDGRPILRTNRLYKSIVTGDGESHLIVECVVSKTSGIFSCVAENSFGEEEVETQIIVQRRKKSAATVEAPTFVLPLQDQGIVDGHPATLTCKIRGVPEPELKWYYIDDYGVTTCLTSAGSGWIECRGGETAELKAERVFKSQQGTYQCIASNPKGEATSQCYLLVGGLTDEPAGPPRFVKCLTDIWTPLGEKMVFEVEVAGCPLPELSWFHNDKKVKEGKDIQILYVSDNKCQLTVLKPALSDMGAYSVEASNVHGVVRTTGFANVGQPRHAEPPQFKIMKEGIAVQPKVAFHEEVKKSASAVRMEMKRKGAAPSFVQGLEDMELKAGASAAVAGKLGRRHAHHHKKPSLQYNADDAHGLAKAIMASALEEDGGRRSVEENPAVVEVRQAIQARNRRICRPKFMIKPKPKKVLEEYKSLRLKIAISANPMPSVHWDKDGIILETGNKYSIYNDGDFYYLEVHHVSPIDKGFYNCTAANSEGILTCSSEVEVVPGESASVQQHKKKSKKEPKAPTFIEVLPGKNKVVAGETMSVECSVSGFPSPWIQWYRNGTPLRPQADKCIMSFDGECATLRLFNVTPADEAVYCCEARNENGEAKTQMNLTVEGSDGTAPNGVPPLFKTEKIRSIIKATDGDKVTLAAELTQGSEPMQIRWLRNKMTITNSLSFQYFKEGPVVKLQIADAFPEDAGEYRVEAKNQWGVAKCIMRLDVQSNEEPSVAEEAPKILDAKTPVRVPCGLAAELRARVIGHPDPVIAWEKGTTPLHNGDKYTMTTEGNVFRMRVNDTVPSDSGKYTLTAVNVAGQTSATIQLVVHEPMSPSSSMPRFTHSPVSVQARLGQRAELRARFAGLPAPVCRWFKGDKELEDGIGGLTISETSDSSTLSIVFLENVHVGEYLCTVRNTLGEDLATAMILLEGSSAALPQQRSKRL